ncbi:VOC family protein [Chloroflexota bacterium]
MEKDGTGKSLFARFDHVGVVVEDMDKAIEHLSSLGLGPFETANFPSITSRTLRGKPVHAKLGIRFCQMGPLKLELLQPLEGESLMKEFLESNGEGLQHLGFLVDDIDKEVAKLTNQGVKVLQRGVRANGGGNAFMEILGFIFELTQR